MGMIRPEGEHIKPQIVKAYDARNVTGDSRLSVWQIIKKHQPCVMDTIKKETGLGKTTCARWVNVLTELHKKSGMKVYWVYAKVKYERNTVIARVYATDPKTLPNMVDRNFIKTGDT